MEVQSQKHQIIAQTGSKRRSAFTKELFKNYDLYLLLVPGIIFFFVFCYVPMLGLVVAFKDYNIFKGILDSDWVGLHHFKEMLQIQDFYRIVRNTLLLNVLGLIVGFPAPIILALMLNEIRAKYFKKISQSLLYLPHFMSWVIMGGIIYNLLSPKYGIVNSVMRFIGMEEIYFMIEETWWVIIYTLSSVWAGAGWGTIIYLAAMTMIDPSLYEAAVMDGAGRWKKIVHITLPGIMPTVIILLILNIGHMVSIGFEHPFALQNPVVTSISEVISTYVYSSGIKQGQFGITTAIGMSQSIINLILVLGANYFAKRLGKEGLW
ncbi:ABC transporter permease [Paenibacillus oryzisoli]|uniref:Polysaccharide ABC transporter ATP-binding protein n=1 Tax=Paenibacillus oryzisoli TaxID=1850517 RepID=A0A197ZXD3_9BACL|nr:ABC transporter permease subunit [Paenibacillus oryzisoli]OAS13466.1 polysaccharide ABC transporter ATP-binding protein [Paenibacillus oryzisoli]